MAEHLPHALLNYMKKAEGRLLKGEQTAEPRQLSLYEPKKELDNHLDQLMKRTDKPLIFSVQNPTNERCLVRFQAQKELVMRVVQKLCEEHKTASVFPQINWFLGKPQEVFLFHNGAKLYYLDGGWWLIGGYSRDGSDALSAMTEFARFV